MLTLERAWRLARCARVLDEDARRVVRTLANRGPAVVGATFLVASAMLIVATDPARGSRDRRAVRRLRLRRLFAPRHRAPAARRRHGRSGRHDVKPVATATAPAQPRSTTARRGALLPPPRRRRALDRLGADHRAPGRVPRGGAADRRGLTVDLGHAAARVADAPPRAGTGPHPGARGPRRMRRHRPPRGAAALAPPRHLVVLAGAVGAGVVPSSTDCSTCQARLPQAVSSGTWLASTRFPNLAVLGGAAAVAAVAEAVAVAIVGAGHQPRPRRVAGGDGAGRQRWAARAAAGVRRRDGARRADPGRVRLAEPAAVACHRRRSARRAPGVGRSTPPATSRRRPRPAVQRHDLVRCRRVRQGVQLGQPRRRSSLPRLPGRSSSADRTTAGRRRHSTTTPAARRSCCCSASRPAVRAPRLAALASVADGSVAVAMDDVGGQRLDAIAPADIDAALLDRVWHEVGALAQARIAHRALRAGNILVVDGEPVVIDFGFAQPSATTKMLRIDHAELLASLGSLVGAAPAVEAAARALSPDDLAATALRPAAARAAAATRSDGSKARAARAARAGRRGHRAGAAAARAPRAGAPRRRCSSSPRSTGRLLPAAAPAGQRRRQLPGHRRRELWRLAAASHVRPDLRGRRRSGWRRRAAALPFAANVETQLALSFVNRVTPGQRRWHGAERPLHAEGAASIRPRPSPAWV